MTSTLLFQAVCRADCQRPFDKTNLRGGGLRAHAIRLLPVHSLYSWLAARRRIRAVFGTPANGTNPRVAERSRTWTAPTSLRLPALTLLVSADILCEP